MIECGFNEAWVGRCKKPAGSSGRCEKHAGLNCAGCGKPATQSCDHTGIQFVCGAPLCDGCYHAPPKKGDPNWFALGGGHKAREVANAEWEAHWKEWERERLEARAADANAKLAAFNGT